MKSLLDFPEPTYKNEVNVELKTKREPEKMQVLENYTAKVIYYYFPELWSEKIYVDKVKNESAFGEWISEFHIGLNPVLLEKTETRLLHVIGHELTHVIQDSQDLITPTQEVIHIYDQDIPSGERACDVWTAARSADLAGYPSYLEMPKIDFEDFDNRLTISIVARDALERRKNGRGKYIMWMEKQICRRLGCESPK